MHPLFGLQTSGLNPEGMPSKPLERFLVYSLKFYIEQTPLEVCYFSFALAYFAGVTVIFFASAPTQIVGTIIGRVIVDMVHLIAERVAVRAEHLRDEAVDKLVV